MTNNINTNLFFVLALVLMCGCRNEPSIEEQMKPKTTACYIAVANKDTAWLKLDTGRYDYIGILEFHYALEKKKYLGQFKGSKHGDTIRGHFDFKVNQIDKWHRNPVAFLKRDGKLIMGVGDFVLIWGSPQFNDRKAIDYEKGKFIFEEGECGN